MHYLWKTKSLSLGFYGGFLGLHGRVTALTCTVNCGRGGGGGGDWDHTLYRVLVLPKQSPWLLGTILDGSPLRHRIPACWHSFCRPRKDDRQSQPQPGINSTAEQDLNSGPEDSKPTTLTIKPTLGIKYKETHGNSTQVEAIQPIMPAPHQHRTDLSTQDQNKKMQNVFFILLLAKIEHFSSILVGSMRSSVCLFFF